MSCFRATRLQARSLQTFIAGLCPDSRGILGCAGNWSLTRELCREIRQAF